MLRRPSVELAAHAHSDLNIFAALAKVLEGGTVYTAIGSAEAAIIIRRCMAVQQRLLREYDCQVARAKKEKPDAGE